MTAAATLSADMTAAKNALIAFFHGAATDLAAAVTSTEATVKGAASATNLLTADLQGALASVEAKVGPVWAPLVADAIQIGLSQAQTTLDADGLGSVLQAVEVLAKQFGAIPAPVVATQQTKAA